MVLMPTLFDNLLLFTKVVTTFLYQCPDHKCETSQTSFKDMVVNDMVA
jgi:hypothetical protein